LRIGRQIEITCIAAHEKNRMRAANGRVSRIPDDCVRHSTRGQLGHASICPPSQLIEIAELDRLCRARLRARRLQARLLTVVAERALERASVRRTSIDDAEGACDDAVPAAVADIGLDEDAAEFRPHDRACRTRLETPGMLAMLADV